MFLHAYITERITITVAIYYHYYYFVRNIIITFHTYIKPNAHYMCISNFCTVHIDESKNIRKMFDTYVSNCIQLTKLCHKNCSYITRSCKTNEC